MVGTFTQPNFEEDGGTEYKTNLDNSIAVISEWGASFAPHEQDTPNMTIRLDAGTLFTGTALVVLAALDTGTITAPATNPRKDIVTLDPTGGGSSPPVYIGVTTGSESATPADPSIASGLIPIARINLTTSTTAIANTDIDDLRGAVWDQSSGGGISNVVEDTTPQLGGNLDVNGHGIVSVSNGHIPITPNGAGEVRPGNTNFQDNTVSRPKLKDYGETVNALGDLGGGTDDIDLTLGNVVSATVSTSTQTFTFSNPPATGTAGSFTLFLTNGGSQTVNWPASVDWAGGTAPTLTASGVDILTFTTIDGGTTWYGFLAGANMS